MDIKNEIKKQFIEDKLFKYLEIQGFTVEQLFPDFLNLLNPEKVYSTFEVAKILNVTDNNLRYYMKVMRLVGYIKSFKAGRNYRFNYSQIYRMYLVVSILELPYHNTCDIKNILKEEKTALSNVELDNKHDKRIVETVVDTSSVDTAQIIEYEKQILNKQFEIIQMTHQLNKERHKLLHMDSKFNLILIENEYANQLKEIMKQIQKGWFSRSISDKDIHLMNETSKDLMDVKEQLNVMQTTISDHEKKLSLKIHELHQLMKEKISLLNRQ